jgi:hypothetical protein
MLLFLLSNSPGSDRGAACGASETDRDTYTVFDQWSLQHASSLQALTTSFDWSYDETQQMITELIHHDNLL